MSEKRRPDSILLLRPSGRGNTKIEIFGGRHFSAHHFQTLRGRELQADELGNYVRLRVNGRWFPRRSRTLYTRWQFTRILKQELFRESI